MESFTKLTGGKKEGEGEGQKEKIEGEESNDEILKEIKMSLEELVGGLRKVQKEQARLGKSLEDVKSTIKEVRSKPGSEAAMTDGGEEKRPSGGQAKAKVKKQLKSKTAGAVEADGQ